MERGRILIMGQTKESTYEIRNLLDKKKFELEIALSADLGRTILTQRQMNLLIMHTETIDETTRSFFEFLEDRGINIPVFILGDEAASFAGTVPEGTSVRCFGKPYPVSDMLTTIEEL